MGTEATLDLNFGIVVAGALVLWLGSNWPDRQLPCGAVS